MDSKKLETSVLLKWLSSNECMAHKNILKHFYKTKIDIV